MSIAAPSIWDRDYLKAQLEKAVLNPVRAFRPHYLPLLMIYFASGAMAVTAIAQSFWVKQSLTLTPSELAALGVWLTLPWTIKMVFGEMVDTVAIMGSQRRAYVYLGASLMALGLVWLAAAAAGKLPGMAPETAYKLASLVIVIGTVMQDVVADAMTTEVVERVDADGSPRAKEDVDRDLGMVQVLGRLSMAIGGFIVAGLGGYMASLMPYWLVFALALVVPVISASGAALVKIAPVEQRPIDWTILGGGIAFGAFVLAMAFLDLNYGQEIIFAASMAVVIFMLRRTVMGVPAETQRVILYAAIIIFVFRATPSVGAGYSWYAIDVLKFDEVFQGHLAQIGAALGLLGIWLFSDAITRQPVARVLFWLTIALTVLSLPSYGLTVGLHEWTARNLGFGAHGIALIDSAVTSPFAELSMIPMLTLIAIYAPPTRRASWFALMGSLMNLALVAANLQTKYLNLLYPIPRGDYANLPELFAIVLVIGLVIPLAVIIVLGRRLR